MRAEEEYKDRPRADKYSLLSEETSQKSEENKRARLKVDEKV